VLGEQPITVLASLQAALCDPPAGFMNKPKRDRFRSILGGAALIDMRPRAFGDRAPGEPVLRLSPSDVRH
jgi:hypothetical protein